MSTSAVAAAIAVGGWLLALTIVVVLCVRQIAIVMVRLEAVARGAFRSSTVPVVGLRISERASALLPASSSGRSIAVLLSVECLPCRNLVDDVASRGSIPGVPDEELVFLLTGPRRPADALASLLPPGVTVVFDPQATGLALMLGMSDAPSAIMIDSGVIAGLALTSSVADLTQLATYRPPADVVPGTTGGRQS
jgi:hypothetical protein